MSNDVLVWQKNPAPAVIHSGGNCPSLYRSVAPDRSVRFAGAGTAGWLPEAETRRLVGASSLQ